MDGGALLKALRDLIQNDQLRAEMAGRSRARALSEFSYTAAARRYGYLYSELMDAAKSLSWEPSVARYRRPAWSEDFAHYSTILLEDPMCLVLTSAGERASRSGFDVFPPIQYLLEPALLSKEVLHATLAAFGGNERTAGHEDQTGRRTLRMGELVSSASRIGEPPDKVRRHVLWLVKHGFLEVVD